MKHFFSLFTLCLYTLATLLPAAAAEKKILVVLSSAQELILKNGKSYKTGFFLNELAIPSQTLSDAGYALVFANPKGQPVSMDLSSDNPRFFDDNKAKLAKYKQFIESLPAFKQPQKLSTIAKNGIRSFAGIFVPGGHAPMQDLYKDPDLGKILKEFHRAKKPTALICHGPAALLSTLSDPEKFVANKQPSAFRSWPYSGYKITCFSNLEEQGEGTESEEAKFGGPMPFYLQTALERAGAKVFVGKKWAANAVQHEELITGQNPASDGDLTNLFLDALKKAK